MDNYLSLLDQSLGPAGGKEGRRGGGGGGGGERERERRKEGGRAERQRGRGGRSVWTTT